MSRYDVAIIGAGIAGASLAAELAPHASVLILEAEDQPGYHATGRSAAFWSETYGGPLIQPLTSASSPWLQRHGLLSPRGELHLARAEERTDIDRFLAEFEGRVRMERWSTAQVRNWLPDLSDAFVEALWIPTCTDIDVAGAHQVFLKTARQAGAELRCHAPLEQAERLAAGWRLRAGGESFEAGILVSAAGAWADRVAALAGVPPVGIQPYRRTVVQLEVDPPAPADLPLVMAMDGSFYFKPEAGGRLWLSPHDETPDLPGDVAADELDVAIAIDRFEQATRWPVRRVERRWAGLRSFAPDRLPVYGYDPAEPRFFWCAGQGGFGIQTAPAAARMAANLLLGRPVEEIDPAPYLPGRFRNA
ncbi:FAD-binding oxidoreductase [Sphingomonas sp. ID1715]|uniref:NAD(P)/FAD-dependent oxidoreductase n=1 Tax=Sphingomonas sp. ID1715 TaxID=1656898 RepID=UPI001488178C|nr:FAD-dependent oxidoreductase [Sphingomonas sp. ID1715]NNM76808.1 FAD-binding oxidoreductase [Sphingomonas sp. ID1715]